MSHFEIQFFQIRNFQLKLFYSFFLKMMMPWLFSFQFHIQFKNCTISHAQFGKRTIKIQFQKWKIILKAVPLHFWSNSGCHAAAVAFYRLSEIKLKSNNELNPGHWLNVRNTLKYSRFFVSWVQKCQSTQMSEKGSRKGPLQNCMTFLSDSRIWK